MYYAGVADMPKYAKGIHLSELILQSSTTLLWQKTLKEDSGERVHWRQLHETQSSVSAQQQVTTTAIYGVTPIMRSTSASVLIAHTHSSARRVATGCHRESSQFRKMTPATASRESRYKHVIGSKHSIAWYSRSHPVCHKWSISVSKQQ